MEAQELHNRIEQYLDNTLSEEEVRAFDQQVLTDEAFAEEVRLHQKLRLALEVAGNDQLREELAALGSSLRKDSGGGTSPLLRQPWLYVGLAAALGIFLLIRGTLPGSTPQSALELYRTFSDVPAMRMVRGNTTDSLMQLAYSAYVMEDFSQAKQYFSRILQIDSTQILVKFYLGISYLQLDQPQESLAYFKEIPQAHAYAQHARWYSALAQLKLGDIAQSEALLTQIVQKNRHYKKAEAEELLRLLKKTP